MSRTTSPKRRRGFSGLVPFLFGVPLAVGFLVFANWESGPLHGSEIGRYLHHPVEWAEVILVTVAAVGMLARYVRLRLERASLHRELIPAWDGQPVAPAQAAPLQEALRQQPRRWQETLLGRRIASILEHLLHRRSAAGLDDHLRTLVDNDAIALESAGTLNRFIIWAVPILGFLGTVLGITGAVSGITPEKLESGLNQVTDGLALAFDSTALALGLTMVLMLVSSLIDRVEQGVLEDLDQVIDEQLAHRFERKEATGDTGSRRDIDELVRRQANLWAETLAQTDRKRTEVETKLQDRLQAAMTTALERTLDAHARRLAELEQHSVKHIAGLMGKMEELAKSAAGHAETLRRLHEGEKQLLVLQQALQQNLQVLEGAGSFDQAVHSLTAAIHLLTSQATSRAHRPGAAA